ncbi:hypothetical protein L209DRAFT_137440 [Thermothelomyces heterothallicus CBS 203.75]
MYVCTYSTRAGDGLGEDLRSLAQMSRITFLEDGEVAESGIEDLGVRGEGITVRSATIGDTLRRTTLRFFFSFLSGSNAFLPLLLITILSFPGDVGASGHN